MEEIKKIMEELDFYGVKVKVDRSLPYVGAWSYSYTPFLSYSRPYNKIITIGYAWATEHIIDELKNKLSYIRNYNKSREVKDESFISFIEDFQYTHD